MLKRLLILAVFTSIAKGAFAQTAEETLAWLRSQLQYLTDRETIHHFAFTETHLEYHGSTYKGKVSDDRVVIFKWKDIRHIGIGYAKVSTNLHIGGKGMLMYGGYLPVNTNGESMPLAYWSADLDPPGFLKMLRRMAELKGAVLEPEKE